MGVDLVSVGAENHAAALSRWAFVAFACLASVGINRHSVIAILCARDLWAGQALACWASESINSKVAVDAVRSAGQWFALVVAFTCLAAVTVHFESIVAEQAAGDDWALETFAGLAAMGVKLEAIVTDD